jgi:DNA polymerase III epsilon subunit-like protein
VLFDKVKPHLADTMVRGKYIMYNLKYPKLDELYYMLFNKHFDNQHNAMADVEATYECYKELLRLGIYR